MFKLFFIFPIILSLGLRMNRNMFILFFLLFFLPFILLNLLFIYLTTGKLIDLIRNDSIVLHQSLEIYQNVHLISCDVINTLSWGGDGALLGCGIHSSLKGSCFIDCTALAYKLICLVLPGLILGSWIFLLLTSLAVLARIFYSHDALGNHFCHIK